MRGKIGIGLYNVLAGQGKVSSLELVDLNNFSELRRIKDCT